MQTEIKQQIYGETYHWVKRLNIINVNSFPIDRFDAIPIKIQASFIFLEIDKLKWKYKGLRRAQTIFKNKKLGGLNATCFQDLCFSRQENVVWL